jgi:hypothetical protein
MTIIYGARNMDQIRESFKVITMPIVKSICIGVPVAVVFAQNFLPGQAGIAFMKLVSFSVSSSIHVERKKNRYTTFRRRRSYYDDSQTGDDVHSNDDAQWNREEQSNDDTKPSGDTHPIGEMRFDTSKIDGREKKANPPVL